MKTKYEFEVMDLDDGLVAVPVGDNAGNFHGVLKVNETAAAILKVLEQESTESEIVEALMRQYDGDKTEIADYVHKYIEMLSREGIIE